MPVEQRAATCALRTRTLRVEDFVAEADRHPVFELLPINEDRPNGDRGR
jgi:hypothetical protein